jgi:hypothetical protein
VRNAPFWTRFFVTGSDDTKFFWYLAGMLCAILVIFIFAGIIMAILPQSK